jgi:hypothetical protein
METTLPPRHIVCPITMEIMKEPVVVENGDSYEKEAIEKWFVTSNTLPLTGQTVSNKALFPNRSLKIYITWWLSKNPQPAPTHFDDNPCPIRLKPRPQSPRQFAGILSATQRVLSRVESGFANVTTVEFSFPGRSTTPRAQSPPAIPWASLPRVVPLNLS